MEVPGTCFEKEASTHLCGPCKVDEVSTNADGFCNGCKECMCSDCFQQHVRVKSCKDHVMVDLDSISHQSETTAEEIGKCSTHTGKTIKFYCRDHNALGCGDCMMFCHSTCKSENIIDLSKDFDQSKTFKAIKKKIEELKTTNKRRVDQIHRGRASYQTKLQKVIEDIKRFRLDMEKHLQQMEDEMIQEAKQISATNNRLLADVDKVCQRISTKLKRMDKLSDAKTYDNKALFINTVDFQSRFSDLDERMKQKPLQIINFNFVADSQLKNIHKLGTLEVTIEKAIEVRVRVQRRNSYRKRYYGTVTAVEKNGIVNVKWDDGISERCTIGHDINSVELCN